MVWSSRIRTCVLVAAIGALTFAGGSTAIAKESEKTPFLPTADVNSDGKLSADEFIMFQGERDMKRRDANKDNIMSKAEWIGPNGPDGFYTIAFNKFNADGNDVLSVDEIVEVYSWVFKNRDKDKSGFLTASEVPKNLLKKK